MNVLLTPELEAYVNQQVASGVYPTAAEVVCEALRLLREQDELRQRQREELRREIALGIEDAEQGRVGPFSAQETLARVRKNRESATSQGD